MFMELITFLLFTFLINFLNNMRLLKKPAPQKYTSDNSSLVSVLVPVRNEEDRIEKCLRSLACQYYPNLEIIVLDDHSTDRTAEIIGKILLDYPNIQFIPGDVLPVGWTGKNFACHQLASKAKGDWLLFTDADTVHSPYTVSSILTVAANEKADLVSLLPKIDCGSEAEKIFMPLVHFAFTVFLPLGLIRKSRLSMALGPFMLFNKKFYNSIGGHEAIHSEVVDDLSLARSVRVHGGKISFLDGSDFVKVRFYRNWREIWNGFTKNSFGAFKYSIPAFVGILVFAYFLFLQPYLIFFKGLFQGVFYQLACFQICLITFIRLVLAQRFKTSFHSAVLHPVAVIIGLSILTNSFWHWLHKGAVSWKGRTYATVSSSSEID